MEAACGNSYAPVRGSPVMVTKRSKVNKAKGKSKKYTKLKVVVAVAAFTSNRAICSSFLTSVSYRSFHPLSEVNRFLHQTLEDRNNQRH